MLQRELQCSALFDIFTPDEKTLVRSKQILIVCRNTHMHPQPTRTKTPPVYLAILKSLLTKLDYKLADATARRIMLDSGFMNGLRMELGWIHARNPVLADLHPSLANMDRVKRIILEVRKAHFPHGTGFEGMTCHNNSTCANFDCPSTRCKGARSSNEQPG